jgi:hypothetical protein
MLPINYEIHCKACHPLTFDPQHAEKVTPHHVQPDQLKEFLTKTFTAEYLSRDPKLLERPIPARRPLPGKTTLVEGPGEEKARRYIEDKVTAAERILYAKTTCGECHEYEGADAAMPQRIVPTAVPEIWFQHAWFDHGAHRAMTCESCHQNAKESTTHADVLLPDMQNCLQCHSPASRSEGRPLGGTRYDCTECHRYHHADGTGTLQGPGAKARAPREKFHRAQDFLSGE